MKKVCEYCGKEFETTINIQKYCNAHCREKEKQKKKHSNCKSPYGEILRCEICGKEFARKSPLQKYCSHECSNFVRAKRRWKCDAPINPKRSHDTTQAMLPEWALLLSVSDKLIGGYRRINIRCKVCGHEMERTTQIFKPNKIGGFKCGCCSLRLSEEVASRRKREKAAQRTIERAEAEQLKRVSITKIPKPYIAKICKQCGKLFTTKSEKLKCCSDDCKRKNANVSKDRRIGKAGVRDYSITLTKLIERDHNICHICGEQCDVLDIEVRRNGVMVAGNNYPSIDHVIPLAKKGNHTWDNVKLAHRICNTIKRDNIM